MLHPGLNPAQIPTGGLFLATTAAEGGSCPTLCRCWAVRGPHSLLREGAPIQKVMLHVGTNDIQQSELLKENFKRLFNYLQRTEREVYISGPLPTVGRGCGCFSRLLQIHLWLQSQCCSFGLGFIDIFNLFWERSFVFLT
uniref:SGNH hydrolase-type esterase domain-containing protein n=1 Tax=Stegastes partitus TaxID=144197 RepID=A0A3B5AET1_9TELE